MKCLLRNKDHFWDNAVFVPEPGLYRQKLRQRLTAIDSSPADATERDAFLEELLGEREPKRVFFSNAHFFGAPRAALRRGLFYPNGPERMAYLKKLFHPHEVELFIAIRDPATFLPACLAQSPRPTMADYTSGMDPRSLRWSDALLALSQGVPGLKMTVWCNEDAPLVWPRVIRAMADLPYEAPVEGGLDLLGEIMSPDGVTRLERFLKRKPGLDEAQFRQVLLAFAGKYSREDAIEEIIDVPGWTEDFIDEISENYDDDIERIAQIPGVSVILP